MRPLRKQVVGDQLQPTFGVGLLVGLATNCCAVQGVASGFYTTDNYFICSGVFVFLMPLILGLYMTWFIIKDTTHINFELILLSGLSEQKIVWGYLRAALIRFQVAVGFKLGFLLFFLLTISFLLLTTVLYDKFPAQQSPHWTELTAQLMMTGAGLGSGTLGIFGMAILNGMIAALAFRRLDKALGLSSLANFLITGAWSGLVLYYLRPVYLIAEVPHFQPSLLAVIFLLYGFFWLQLKLAYHLVRHPLVLE
jgi:hypothetical protein